MLWRSIVDYCRFLHRPGVPDSRSPALALALKMTFDQLGLLLTMRFATPNTVRHRGITAVATKTIRMVSTTNAIFMAIRRRVIVVIFGL